MNKLEQMRASDNDLEEGVKDYELEHDNSSKSQLEKFKEEYFAHHSDIKTSIKEDW